MGPGEYSQFLGSVGRIGNINRLGSINSITRIGSIGNLARLGSVTNVARLGSVTNVARLGSVTNVARLGSVTNVARLGSVTNVARLGSVTNVARLGSVTNVARLGSVTNVASIGRVGTAHTGTVPSHIRAAELSVLVIRDRVPLGQGSVWQGSWQHVGSYPMWQFSVWGRPSAGSFAIVGGVSGTGADGITGTIYGYQQVAGTILDFHPPPTVRRVVRYVKPVFLRTGLVRGSVSIGLTKQAF